MTMQSTNPLLRLLLVLLLFGLGLQPAAAREAPPAQTGNVVTLSEFWTEARQAQAGQTSAQGNESGVLINNAGEAWRQNRNGPVSSITTWLLGLAVVGIALVYFTRGRMRIEAGRSGKTVERWSAFNRFLHWYVAVLFMLLMISGLSILFGKYVLIPVIGKAAFATWASAMKLIHNYSGPLFTVGLLAMAVLWAKDNIFNALDAKWLAVGGGILTDAHPSAGYMNGGEKIWFWLAVIGGGVVAATGLIMLFPGFGQLRETMQFANLLHSGVAGALMAVFLGHLYIATLGTEGALEGMWNGHVDENWAKQHHDLWYEEVKKG